MSKYQTNILAVPSSFWSGAASVFALWGSDPQFTQYATPEEADFVALLNDFGVVGEDLYEAMSKLGYEPEAA